MELKQHLFKIRSNLLLFIFLIAHSSFSTAADRCLALFMHPASELIELNPVTQLRLWEQTSNQGRWEKPTAPQKLSYVRVEPEDTTVRTESFTPQMIKNYFQENDFVKWVRHPLNSSDTVPYRQQPQDGYKKAFYSASRSMFTMIKGALFSFKLPTDRPHPVGDYQPGKADLNNDSVISMRRSKHIREYDAKHARTSELYVLTEVISVASKQGNAFSVRDLRPLQDGNYYLPAFSIPYAGREIARINNTDFNVFWNKYYGELLGQAKAQLLLRYGLQMKTPNAQNWLIQLDSNLKPTGRIYMRDVADSNYVEFIASRVGASNELQDDKKSNFTIMESLAPYWENSAWQMDEGGVSLNALASWGRTHDSAYINTFVEALNLDKSFSQIWQLESFLKTEEGQEALKKFGEKQNLSFNIFQFTTVA